MTPSRFFSRTAALLAVLLLITAPGRSAVELLDNGDFSVVDAAGDGLPTGWTRGGRDGFVTLEKTDDGDALFLAVDGPGQTPVVGLEVALTEPAPVALRLGGEVRPEGVRQGERPWYSGRMLVTYLDGRGEAMGETYTLDRLEGTSDWRAVRRQFPVPPGARRARLELQLLQPAGGRIGFRDLSLLALDEAAAQEWRAAAEARIREHRMAPLRVRVLDANGDPAEGAEVAVFMRRHAYPFGTAARAAMLNDAPADAMTETYRAVVERFFNYVTIENALKVKVVEARGLEAPLAALEWLRARDIAVRGHVLTWPSFQMSSKAENAVKDDPAALRATMRRLFRERLEATAPYDLVDWDVVNEPTVHNDLMGILGDDIVADWFRWAKEDAPHARLYLNENNVEFGGGNREGIERWIRRLQSAGAPLEGFGMQGHMWHRTLPSGQNILDDLDHFAPYGLPIQITEYDVNDRFSDEEEARFLDEFLTAWFSHPSTAGFIMWGFKDDLMWNGNAPLFRADWSLKPAGRVWMEHVFGRWWTEARGRGDAAGVYSVHGYAGDYEVEAVFEGRRATASVRLDAGATGGAEVTLRPSAPAAADERLASSNPYRLGLLPEVVVQAEKRPEDYLKLVLTPETGGGASALLPEGRDLYARFDLAEAASRKIGLATLAVRLAGAPDKSARLRVHALSNRFVPQDGEASVDWTPADIAEGRAPGRDHRTGDYRPGDAAVIYLGAVSAEQVDADGRLLFSSAELVRAASGARSPGLTLIVSTSGASLDVRSIELELGIEKAAVP